MNPASLRRFGAVLALSLVAFCGAANAADSSEDSPRELRHGSRAKAHDGTLVAYDKVTGVFVVPSLQDTFWIGNRFYRCDNGVWTMATAAAGPWELTAQHLVPDVARERFSPPKTQATARLPSGREAIYEPRLKVYRVVGRRGVFLFDGLFYRYETGVWLESTKDDGPWKTTSMKPLPATLRNAVPVPESGQKVLLPTGETAVYQADGDFFFLQEKPETLLFDGTFYEKRDRKWFSSSQASSGFTEVVSTARVPVNVRKGFRPGDKGKAAGKNASGGKAEGTRAGAGKPDASGKSADRNAKADQ